MDEEDWTIVLLSAENEKLRDEVDRLAEALKHIASVLDIESYPENGSLESQLGALARTTLKELLTTP